MASSTRWLDTYGPASTVECALLKYVWHIAGLKGHDINEPPACLTSWDSKRLDCMG
jgi:hypothetical protein